MVRPISLTILVMKIFERIIKQELLDRTLHLIDHRQHGFLNLKLCTRNIIEFLEAFDSVNHDLILQKL